MDENYLALNIRETLVSKP